MHGPSSLLCRTMLAVLLLAVVLTSMTVVDAAPAPQILGIPLPLPNLPGFPAPAATTPAPVPATTPGRAGATTPAGPAPSTPPAAVTTPAAPASTTSVNVPPTSSPVVASTPILSTPLSTPPAARTTPVLIATLTSTRGTPSATEEASAASATESPAATAQQQTGKTKKVVGITAAVAGIIGGAVALAALGIYVFRKVTLSPSGDFRKRMMHSEYGSAERLKPSATTDDYGSTPTSTPPASTAGSGPRRQFLTGLNEVPRQEYAVYPYTPGQEYGPEYVTEPPAVAAPVPYVVNPAIPAHVQAEYRHPYHPQGQYRAYSPAPGSDYGGSNHGRYDPQRPYGY
ncbi:hypothetical protein DFJ77DRAFT_450141 [Powellomyces hirtus]|nr:hypothetical protein DFJ77DRAFT_450141 [Powellomyces hirtus]